MNNNVPKWVVSDFAHGNVGDIITSADEKKVMVYTLQDGGKIDIREEKLQ